MSSRTRAIDIFFIRIADLAKVLPPTNLSTTILLAMTVTGARGLIRIDEAIDTDCSQIQVLK